LLAKYLIGQVLENGEIDNLLAILNPWDYWGRFLLRILVNVKVTRRCAAGRNSFCVDQMGDIYPCPPFAETKKLKLGNVKLGINKKPRKKLLVHNVEKTKECRGCWAKYLCGGECMYNSYINYGDLDTPLNPMCELKKHLIKISIYFCSVIRKDRPWIIDIIEEHCKKTGKFKVL
jgi:uncharacterized protein